jgi:exodeoxyribonuclease III
MRIATWNVNSIRARLERLLAWLGHHEPDVLCLQELKVTDDEFPLEALSEVGYAAAVHGQPTYNGVALLTRTPVDGLTRGLGDRDEPGQARLVSGVVSGIRVASIYVPNGSEVGSDKYEYKLEWLERLGRWVERAAAAGPLVVCGDLNIAPDDLDIARPDEWQNTVLTTEEVRGGFRRLLTAGLVDVFRQHHPEGGVYSWWDYRRLAFAKGDGIRLDHVLTTADLASHCTEAWVDREERKGEKPSDHAPVVAEFAVP